MPESMFSYGVVQISLATDSWDNITILKRKEGNDQESIQLPHTFRSKTPKGKKEALKVTAPQSKHRTQKAKRTFFPPKLAKRLSKIKNFINAKTHNDIQ